MPLHRLMNMPIQLRKQAGAFFIDSFLSGLSRAGRFHPHADPGYHGIEVLRDVAYLPGGHREHRLDIWRARQGGHGGAVLYVHGGGFRILSKDTHWIMALAFARRGYTVFNVGYRLAPRHPFPAAIEDVCAAYAWVARHGAAHGADLSRFVLAGESAGGNLVTAVTLAACWPRPEPWARAVFDTGLVPRVTIPVCGMLQVTDPGRIQRRKPHMSQFVQDRLSEVSENYLSGPPPADAATMDLADPLLALERSDAPERPLPAFFSAVGTRDALLDDTRRLHAALERRGVTTEVKYYPGELHAFHALVFRPGARQCWADTFAFLDRHLPRPAAKSA